MVKQFVLAYQALLEVPQIVGQNVLLIQIVLDTKVVTIKNAKIHVPVHVASLRAVML